ncbi:diaminopimelate decarboxylase [Candidatus Woesearchaeota archaeon]|nr:diaminopimelate decarboxylase [Candidatus Woesearchaeota archaeon]|tara:strand:+ start:3521 stop:4759 length:1239 start_codon:yes stop_codon:yes gene_type:complete
MHLSNELLTKLVKKYGTPLYVYDSDLIIQKYNELKSCFTWPKTRLFYAIKANYNTTILSLLNKNGACVDAVSLGEVTLALKTGFQKEKIIFTANSLRDDDIKQGIKLGILFNMGSLSELERYGRINPNSNVCLRFNPNVVAGDIKTNQVGGKNSKFGIQLKDVDKVKKIVKKHNFKVIGLHEHTGSTISEVGKAYESFENLLEIAKKQDFPDLEFLDFGGGFNVPYKPDEKQIDYKSFGKKVSRRFAEFCKEYCRELYMYLEPGRFIVAESGHLVVRATTLKDNDGILFAGTDSGFPQLMRPAFHGSYHQIVNLTNPDGTLKKYNVHGNICENSDYFAFNRPIPEIREGDFLAIKTAGAYCYSMGGVYNLFPMPAEVIVENGKDRLSRKRLTNEELANQIITESSVEGYYEN